MTIRIVIADDQQLVRTGFRMILGLEPDLEIVGEAATGNEAIALAAELKPDLVLMDIRMPELDGIKATRRILAAAEPACRVLVLTTFDLDEYVYDALAAGASGLLLKDSPADLLVTGVRMAAAGDSLLAPGITRRRIERFVVRPYRCPQSSRT
jgi:DNA-binding NarL/FixJ family response regulator